MAGGNRWGRQLCPDLLRCADKRPGAAGDAVNLSGEAHRRQELILRLR